MGASRDLELWACCRRLAALCGTCDTCSPMDVSGRTRNGNPCEHAPAEAHGGRHHGPAAAHRATVEVAAPERDVVNVISAAADAFEVGAACDAPARSADASSAPVKPTPPAPAEQMPCSGFCCALAGLGCCAFGPVACAGVDVGGLGLSRIARPMADPLRDGLGPDAFLRPPRSRA